MAEYWAAAPVDKIAANIERKFSDYRQWIKKTGYLDRMRTSYRRFYAMDKQGSLRVLRDEDDIARLDVNHFKSLLTRMHIMATEAKLSYQPKARTSDSKSQVQSDIGRGACEYYGDEKDMNGVLSSSVLGALIMLERTIHAPWDDNEGYELTADGQRIVTEGDQAFEEYNALDVARNTTSKKAKSNWYIIRKRVNKWDYAALHPDFAEDIKASQMVRDTDDMEFALQNADGLHVDDDDYTWLYILYHERTASMQQGRWTEICASHVLRDGELEYSRMPVSRMTAGDVMDTCFGDSPSVDLLAIQECLNAIFSGWMTNGLNNALQLLYCQDPNLITRKLESGQTLVSAASEPKALNLNGSGDGLQKIVDALLTHAQLISGVNDVARGNPSSNLKSGSSLAVVLAQAIQYVAAVQKNYARVAGEIGTILLCNLKKFGPEEFIGYIAGISREGQVKKFKREDLMDVERVTVDLGNPLTQNIAGRYELAKSWSELKIMTDAKQIESFIRTGNLDQVTENDFSDELLIRDENEQIKRGIVPPVLLLDLHNEHIMKHKAVFSSPEARDEERIVKAGLDHIQWHIDTMREVPPDLGAVLSGQPLPPLEMDPNALPPGEGGLPPNPAIERKENPTVNGARMPSLPPEAPMEAREDYDQALNAMPEETTTFN